MKVNEEVWKFMQHHLGYTDEELEIFRNNPKNVDIVSKAPDLMKKTIIAEVVASNGCNSQHKVGINEKAGTLVQIQLCIAKEKILPAARQRGYRFKQKLTLPNGRSRIHIDVKITRRFRRRVENKWDRREK